MFSSCYIHANVTTRGPLGEGAERLTTRVCPNAALTGSSGLASLRLVWREGMRKSYAGPAGPSCLLPEAEVVVVFAQQVPG